MNNTESKQQFAFGKNWAKFLQLLSEERIIEAENSLKNKLNCTDLTNKVFLDVGCGSGLFSLAAYRLGAIVYSFDYDQDSVNCTQYLKDKYAKYDTRWSVQQGSVLDKEFLKQFGQVDILYSWGVLHHTGNMYQAFENVGDLVKPGGVLFISIYNDQGVGSYFWSKIKQAYNNSNSLLKKIILFMCFLRLWGSTFIKDFIKNLNPVTTWMHYKKNNRGMSAWHDVVDWVGGYPFEVAKPEEVFEFFKATGFALERFKTCGGGHGCNEFVMVKKG